MSSLYAFISGMIGCGCAVAGAFFVKFWRRTHERLFLIFGFAFFMLAAERLVHELLFQYRGEDHVAVYTIRLLAFVLIAGGIIDKNRSERR